MTALDDAARAVAEARRDVHEFFVLLAATEADKARAVVARLEAAVRHHDAETMRALPLSGVEAGVRDALATQVDPNETPAVEVRYAGGPTIRIARYSVTADAETGRIVVEGFIAFRTGQPHSGDTVRIAYLGIPGRGALMDVDASVELFSRLEVLHIRIRTTIRTQEAQ